MNHPKPSFKTVLSGFIAIFTGVAFAPIFEADAAFTPAQHFIQKLVAGEDSAKPETARPLRSRKGLHDPSVAAPAEQPAAAPSQPRGSEPNEFDGPTTFAKNEISGSDALSNVSDARIFGRLGSGGIGGGGSASSPVAKKISATSPAASDDLNDKTDAAPSDEQKPTEKPQDQARDDSNPQWQADKPRGDTKPNATVPEPSALALIFIGVCGLVVARRLA